MLFAAAALAAAPLGAETMTREQGDALLQEMKAIRQLLERQQAPRPGPAQPPAPERVKAGLKSAFAMGKADILWRHASTGENYLYRMNGTTILGTEGYLRTVPQPDWQVQNAK